MQQQKMVGQETELTNVRHDGNAAYNEEPQRAHASQSTVSSKGSSDGEGSSGSSISEASFNAPKKSIFQQLGQKFKNIMKKGKDAETETTEKSRLRYITFDQGRILILKRLRDPIDGDNYS